MPRFVEPVTLRGEHAMLEPMGREHAVALAEAARDGELWRLWYTSLPVPEAMGAYVESALAMREEKGAMPFVVRERASGAAVGSTRMFNVEATHRRLEIGHTWYAKRVQRTGVNTRWKLMLLAHAFDALSCNAAGVTAGRCILIGE